MASYASDFNLKNYKYITKMTYIQGSLNTPGNYILDEVSATDELNVMSLTVFNKNNLLFWCNDNKIILDTSIASMSRQLTDLQKSCMFNTSLFNYKYVKNMHLSYANCYSLNEKPLAPNNSITMYGCYYNCSNLTGFSKAGENIVNMYGCYYNCSNLTGVPNFSNALILDFCFYNCVNLSGTLSGDFNGHSLQSSFYNCYLLEGNPLNCNNTYIAINSYYNCQNLYGEFNWLFNGFHQASKINMTNMFYHRNPSQMLTIYAWENYAIANALLNYSQKYGNIYGTGAITWTQTDTLTYYNSQYNTRIILLDDGDEPDPDPD